MKPNPFLLLAALACTAGPLSSAGLLGRDHPIVNAYYAQWTVYSGFTVKTVDTSGTARQLDVLTYAFVNIGTNALGQYECTSYDSWADNGTGYGATPNTSVGGKVLPSNGLTGNFGQLLLLKQKYPDLKIVITIGGASLPPQAFAAMSSTAASREHFVSSCIADYIQGHFTGAFGQQPNQWEPKSTSVQTAPGPPVPDTPGLFDGIEIDWEFPTAADTANFTALMKEFRRQLDAIQKHRYILSYDAPAGQQNFSNIDIAAVDRYVTYVDLMTYDYSGPWQSQTGFVAPLRATQYDPDPTLNIVYTVNSYVANGASPEKILLGVPLYAYGWKVNAPSTREGQFEPATPLAVSTEPFSYIKTTVEPVWQLFRDRETNGGTTSTPWLFDGTTYWTFDDEHSIHEKMTFAANQGLGGAFAWELSNDLPDGDLMRAIYAGLNGQRF
ncbi:MAG: hypothetical protein JO061_23765 [Acidobacteriaceae bacterium]|nr:hypothetical protein [Acidobacteriaceae bacterium]